MNTTINFKPLQKKHLPLLLTWLQAPHIKKWWDSDVQWTPELIAEKYGSYVHNYKLEHGVRKPIYAFIISLNKTEIGYIQLYNPHDFERNDGVSLKGLPRNLAAIDILIGDPQFIGKGFGAPIITQFCHEYIDEHFDACFITPETANSSAIRAYEKAGFSIIGTANNDEITTMIRY